MGVTFSMTLSAEDLPHLSWSGEILSIYSYPHWRNFDMSSRLPLPTRFPRSEAGIDTYGSGDLFFFPHDLPIYLALWSGLPDAQVGFPIATQKENQVSLLCSQPGRIRHQCDSGNLIKRRALLLPNPPRTERECIRILTHTPSNCLRIWNVQLQSHLFCDILRAYLIIVHTRYHFCHNSSFFFLSSFSSGFISIAIPLKGFRFTL